MSPHDPKTAVALQLFEGGSSNGKCRPTGDFALMRRKTKLGLAIVVASIVIAIAVRGLFFPVRRKPGRFKVPGRAYCMASVYRTLKAWQETGRAADRDDKGRLHASYGYYLVIDTAKRGIWIESEGKVLQNTYSDLLDGMEWKLYHCRPKGNRELSGLVRLKIRGIHTKRIVPEALYLVGREVERGHINFLLVPVPWDRVPGPASSCRGRTDRNAGGQLIVTSRSS